MKKTAEKAENLLGIAVTIRIKFNSTIMATMPFYLFLATMVEIAVPAAPTQKLICGLIHKDQDKKDVPVLKWFLTHIKLLCSFEKSKENGLDLFMD